MAENTEILRQRLYKTEMYMGDFDPNREGGYDVLNQCSLFGCVWESKRDNNSTAPAVWDGGDTITPNTVDWKQVSGDYEAWLLNKDKPATTGTTGSHPYNGMGRIVLKKNMVGGVNTLYQYDFNNGRAIDGVPQTNTVFVIKYDFVLGEDITLGANCVLKFEGGSISGTNTLTLANTTIEADKVVFDCPVSGTVANETVYVGWFGSYVFENINSLLASGKTFLFVNKEYTCNKEIKIFFLNNVTLDFNGATINDRINDYEPELSSLQDEKYRYAPFIFSKGCNGLVIRNLNYKARVSDTVYDWNTAVIAIGRPGDAISIANKNIIIENCNFYDSPGSISSKFGCIGFLGDSSNAVIRNVVISDASYNCGMNFEYGAKDTNDDGLTGMFPYNIRISNITGINLKNMSNGLIRTGGCYLISIENIRCVDVYCTFNLFSGDDGCNTFEGHCLVNNVKIKNTKAFIDTITSGAVNPIVISNVAYSNGTTDVPFDSFHQIVNNFIFNNVELCNEEINARFAALYITNNRGKVVFNNMVVKGYYGLGQLHTSNVNDADGNPIESWGVEFNHCKFVVDRGIYILGGKIKNLVLNDVYLSGKFVLTTRSLYNTKIVANHCTFNDVIWSILRHEQIENFTGFDVYYEDVVSNQTNTTCLVDSILKKCDNCVSSNGHIIERSGTFASKPTAANGIPVGFKYFCTDKQTTEGATNGIEIFHKGSDVWVDALGRVVN